MQRKYTKEFKKDIVGYVLADRGRAMREVAEGFGVILSALERWVSESKAKSRGSVVKDVPPEERRILELEQEVARLRKANDLIRNTLVYFITNGMK